MTKPRSSGHCNTTALAGSVSRCGGRPFAIVWSPIPLITWLMPFIGHMGVCSSTGRTYDFAGPYTVSEDDLLFGRPTRYVVLGPAWSPASADSGGLGAVANHDQELGQRPQYDSRQDEGCRTRADSSGGKGRGPYGMGSAGPGAAEEQGEAATAVSCCPDGPTAAAPVATAAAAQWDKRLAFAATTYRLMMYNIMTHNCHCFVAHFLNQVGYRGGGWDMVSLAAFVFLRARYTSPAAVAHTWLPWAVLVALGGYFGRLIFLYVYLAVCVPLLAWFVAYTWCCWTDLSF